MIKCHVGRVGGCLRALSLHMFGVPDIEATDKATRKIFDDGNEVEAEVIRELREEGYKLTNGLRYHKILDIGGFKVKLTGTPDIMITPKKKEYPGEIKSMNYWRYKKVGTSFESWDDSLKEKYSYQMGGYLALTEAPFIYWIVKEKPMHKNTEPKIMRVFPHEVKSMQEIQDRIKLAIGIFKGEEILPDNFYNCKYCSVFDSTTNWFDSPCAQKHTKEYKKKKSSNDRPFLKRFKLLNKDIKQRLKDVAVLEERNARYKRIVEIKYGKEMVNEYT